MIGAVAGLFLLMALLGVLFYCARMLLPLISPALRVLVMLLVAVVALYVLVVLLGKRQPLGRDVWRLTSVSIDGRLCPRSGPSQNREIVRS